MSTFVLSRQGERRIQDALLSSLRRQSPGVLCGASAYLSTYGAGFLIRAQNDFNMSPGFFIAGVSGYITHPNAIRLLQSAGWSVRLAGGDGGIFHPKVLVAGEKFSARAGLKGGNFGYVGSANLTKGGLLSNTEIGYIAEGAAAAAGISAIFESIWVESSGFSADRLARYEIEFSRRMQARTPTDLIDLGVITKEELRGQRTRNTDLPAVEASACATVWVGLQSFTGEHRFQVEIPGRAGRALSGILGTSNGVVSIRCTDGLTRDVRYAYYKDNGMYRMNLPNDVPLVDWARTNKSGILLVSHDALDQLYMGILRGDEEIEVQSRSYALGTWGATSTRRYGWY